MSAMQRTVEEFCALVADGQKADLLDGVIYFEGPEETRSNELHVWLLILLASFVEAREQGRVFAFRIAFRLDNWNAPEPDIAFVKKARAHLIKYELVDGRPDLLVEIVSPETIERDYEHKRSIYESAQVPEYWIVDEIEQKVTLLRLADDGKFREVRPRKGKLRSEVLPGFWLRPEWLWQEPCAKKTDVLALLLAK